MTAASGSVNSIDIVLTMVHGTGAEGAAWTQASSLLSTTLIKKLGLSREDVIALPWGGGNNHRARRCGTLRLRRHIKRIAAARPGSRQVIIAHSHGGNVALSALEDVDTRRRVHAVVCMATPFLQFRPRDMRRAFTLLGGVFALMEFFASMMLVILPFALGILSGIDVAEALGIHGWIGKAIVSMPLIAIWALPFGVVYLLWEKASEAMVRRLEALGERQVALRRQLELSLNEETPVLCVRVPGDEALAALRGTWHLSGIPAYVMSRISPWLPQNMLSALGAGILANTILVIIVALTDFVFRTSISDSKAFSNAANYVPGFIVVGIVVQLLVIGLMPLFGVIRAIGYGESPMDGCCADISAVKMPTTVPKADLLMVSPSELPAPERAIGLRHCRVYDAPVAVTGIATWVGEKLVAKLSSVR